MSKGMRILALVASIIGAGANMALAQELRSTNQVPGLLGQASDEITITNMDDNKVVNIDYLADNAWKSVQISPHVTMSFKGRANGLKVSFNDGAVAQISVLEAGGRYAMVGNEAGRWVVRAYDDVARSDTGLRAR
jgi:hypothetical protein